MGWLSVGCFVMVRSLRLPSKVAVLLGFNVCALVTSFWLGTGRMVCADHLDGPFFGAKNMMNSMDFVLGMGKMDSWFSLKALMIVTLLGLGGKG